MVSLISNNQNAVTPLLQNSLGTSLPALINLGSFLFTLLSLPSAQAAQTDLKDRDISHFCAMLGKRTGLVNLQPFLSFFSLGENRIHCSFKADNQAKTIPTKNYKALIQNGRGNYVNSHEEFTIRELSEQGLYTFDFPEETTVERTIFCGEKANSCNKFIRNAQEMPKELSMAVWKGWGLDEVFQYMDEIAHAEEYDFNTMGLKIEGNEEGIRFLNRTHSVPSYVEVEQI